jgi:hypothetical protein
MYIQNIHFIPIHLIHFYIFFTYIYFLYISIFKLVYTFSLYAHKLSLKISNFILFLPWS